MKKKYFFVILFLILAIFLGGCGGVVTPSISDKAQIQNLMSNFCAVASDGNWRLVQSYYYPIQQPIKC
jgi:uncharacterized protein YceK